MTPCREKNCHDDRKRQRRREGVALHCGAGLGRVHKDPLVLAEFERSWELWPRTGPGGGRGPHPEAEAVGVAGPHQGSRVPTAEPRDDAVGAPGAQEGCWPGGPATEAERSPRPALKVGPLVPAGRAYPSGGTRRNRPPPSPLPVMSSPNRR